MTTTFQITVTRAAPNADHNYVVEIFGIKANSANIEQALETLTKKLFKTRKQLTELPDSFKTDVARETLRLLSEFLPKPSNSTDWE